MLVDKKKIMIRACLVPVFENMKNTILVFFENLFLLFEFSIFCVFQNKKNLGTKRVLHVFLDLLVFENIKQFSKT